MAERSKNFISFVALGGLNPQILNIDFLKNSKILPLDLDREPSSRPSGQQATVKKFVSVPGLANLVLENNIEFIVDERRFQITEKGISEWTETKVLDIAQNYFEVLPYTPLKLVGVNLNSTVTFDGSEEDRKFQGLFLPSNTPIVNTISKDNITASIILRYPYSVQGDRITLTLEQPNKENSKRIVNFNYEFDFVDWGNFRRRLAKLSEIADYSDSILGQLLKAI